MAIWRLVSWANDTCDVELEINASNILTWIRRHGTRPATVVVSLPDGSRERILNRTATEFELPTGPAARIQLTFDSDRNRWDGLAGYVIDE